MSDRTRHENYPSGLLHPAQAAAMPRTNRIAVKESMLSTVDRCVIAREGNVVRVNFSTETPIRLRRAFLGLVVSGGAAPRPLTMRQGRSHRGPPSSIQV